MTFRKTPTTFTDASGTQSTSTGQGSIILKLKSGTQITLHDVLYYEKSTKNLISVSQISGEKYKIKFYPERATVTCFKTKIIIAYFKLVNRLYQLQDLVIHQIILSIADTSHAQLTHRRLEHPGTTVTSILCKNKLIKTLRKTSDINIGFCKDCALGKSTRKPFHTSDSISLHAVL